MSLPPLSDLLALLPDNTVGAIQPVNQRDITSALYNGIIDNTALFENYLPLSGGQMIGDLRLPNPPVNLLDACNKAYVDSVAGNAGFVQKGGDTMDGDLIASSDNAPTPRSYTPRIYTEQLISDTFTAVNPLLPDGSVNMAADYTPTNAKGLVTKEYADALTPDNTGNLRSDGSVDMDAGYTPQNPLSITTKEFVEDTFSWSTVELLSAPVTAVGATPSRVDFANGFTINDFDEILITAEVLVNNEGQGQFVKVDSTLITRQMYVSIYGDNDNSGFVINQFINSTLQDSIRANVIENDPTGFTFKNDFLNDTNNLVAGTRLISIQGRKKGKIDNVVINNVYRASFEMAANQFVDTTVNQASLLVNSKRIDNQAFSHTDGSGEITILKDGWLKCTGTLGYATTVEGDNCRAVGRTLARVNAVNLAGTAVNAGYIRGIDTSGSNISSSCPITFEIPVVAGDIVEVRGSVYKIDNACTTTTFLLSGENNDASGFQISNFSLELVEDGA